MKKIIYCLAFFSLLSSASLTLASSPDGKQYVGLPYFFKREKLNESVEIIQGFESAFEKKNLLRGVEVVSRIFDFPDYKTLDMIVLDVTKLKEEMEESELRDKIKLTLPRASTRGEVYSIEFEILALNRQKKIQPNGGKIIKLENRYKSLEDIKDFDYCIGFQKIETSSSNANRNRSLGINQNQDNDKTPLMTKKTSQRLIIGGVGVGIGVLVKSLMNKVNQVTEKSTFADKS